MFGELRRHSFRSVVGGVEGVERAAVVGEHRSGKQRRSCCPRTSGVGVCGRVGCAGHDSPGADGE